MFLSLNNEISGRMVMVSPVGGAREIAKFALVYNGLYHLVMTNSLPWKDPPFLIGKAR
jgi:hypothetical protein